jgi:hypothetical protein
MPLGLCHQTRNGRKWDARAGSVAEPKLFVSAPAPTLKNVSAPAPEPALAIDLELPVITDFILKSEFFMFFYKRKST